MEQYTVTGMSCAACSARVEKAVTGLPGVTSCSVSLLTNSMGVEGTAAPEEIIRAVEMAGYGAAQKGSRVNTVSEESGDELLEDKATPELMRRLGYSMGFLLVLMYFSMGHMVGLPLPGWYHGQENALVDGIGRINDVVQQRCVRIR